MSPLRPAAATATPAALAGTRAGQGRPHPGRDGDAAELGPDPDAVQPALGGQDGTVPPTALPAAPPAAIQPPAAPPAVPVRRPAGTPARPPRTPAPGPSAATTTPAPQGRQIADPRPARVLRVLPLGTGLALLGLGLGVIAVRLRRR
ncbi:hypothetical protein [Streptomyces sp. ICBB 8177]|uniref:hypothetical protein n=1 Tax=Streptomyces sp. ICBB 8177 TaxID=563922 RepID=UPI0011B47F32|nr:hypothetical protein [Streptomyces sp. ICBB 8177]